MNKIGRDVDKLILVDTVNDQLNENLLLLNSWKG